MLWALCLVNERYGIKIRNVFVHLSHRLSLRSWRMENWGTKPHLSVFWWTKIACNMPVTSQSKTQHNSMYLAYMLTHSIVWKSYPKRVAQSMVCTLCCQGIILVLIMCRVTWSLTSAPGFPSSRPSAKRVSPCAVPLTGKGCVSEEYETHAFF